MSNPFDLTENGVYQAWRTAKLRRWPSCAEALRVPVARLADPSPAELEAITDRLDRCNLALVACPDPGQVEPRALLAFGRRLGLERLDNNLCADEQGVSAIEVRTTGGVSEYVPYTDRPLSWHTDGYYNAAGSEVRAWTLFCVRDAVDGGENALYDPEIAYLQLRDEDPGLVRALMDPEALRIPANVQGDKVLRPASTGPVFSVIGGRLHMRYSARARNVEWTSSPALATARERLTRLLSQPGVYMFRHKLRPGEGYVTNNVLHNRAGFTQLGGAGRLLLRARYLDRVETPSPSEDADQLPSRHMIGSPPATRASRDAPVSKA